MNAITDYFIKYGRLVIIAVVLHFCFSVAIPQGFAGQCDYPDDRARDGSICGDRAASVRPGGRNPDTDWLVWVIIIGAGAFFVFKKFGDSD